MYFKRPLYDGISYRYFTNLQSKTEPSIFSRDNISGTIPNKFVPEYCYPDYGSLTTLSEILALQASHEFPCVLLCEELFSRTNNSHEDKYLIVPIVLASDISPFSHYVLESDGIDYPLTWFRYRDTEARNAYNRDLVDISEVATKPGESNHNPGILYLVFPYIDVAESDVAYRPKAPVYLDVYLGNPEVKSVQRERIGKALSYIRTIPRDIPTYCIASVLDSSNRVLGYKNIDALVRDPEPAFIRLAFSKPLVGDLEVNLTSIPQHFNSTELPLEFLEAFQPQISEENQYYVTMTDAADFGGSGTFTIPAGSTEFRMPITLDSGDYAQVCLYRYSLSDLVTLNNDILIRSNRLQGGPEPSDFANEVTYKLTSMDGLVVFGSGELAGTVYHRNLPNEYYKLTLTFSNVDLVEYILRSQSNQPTIVARKPVFHQHLNWCSHDQISNNVFHSTPYGFATVDLEYKLTPGDHFKLTSLLSFVAEGKEHGKSIEVVL